MDLSLMDLWLPILVSAVVVFFASFLAHMVLPHHKKEWSKLPQEDKMLELVRSGGAPPGQYMFPHCENMADLKDPEKKKKWEQGPFGIVRVCPAMPNMGRNLALTFVTYLVIGVFVAYLAAVAMNRGAEFMPVFRFTATAAIMAHCLGFIGHSIWYGQPLKYWLFDTIDGIVYGLLVGATFAFLWPALEGPSINVPGING